MLYKFKQETLGRRKNLSSKNKDASNNLIVIKKP